MSFSTFQQSIIMLCLICSLYIPHRNGDVSGEKGFFFDITCIQENRITDLQVLFCGSSLKNGGFPACALVASAEPEPKPFYFEVQQSARWTGGLLRRQPLKLACCAEEGAEPGGKAFFSEREPYSSNSGLIKSCVPSI